MSGRLAEVAARATELAAEVGAGPEQAKEFLRHYFRHVDVDDVLARATDDLLGLVGAHYRLALQRQVATANVAVFTPRAAEDGWSAQGATVVQLITDDKPFLVDTVTMEVIRQGWSVREIYHPQFVVHRDVTGKLHDVVHTAEAKGDATAIHESWIHLELLPGPTHQTPADLADGLQRVLRDVEEAVEDWGKMRERAAAVVTDLEGEERALLEWLAGDNFTFLGYRRYRVAHDRSRYEPVPGTGLGILRADSDTEHAFHAFDPDAGTDERVVITKDNFKSSVHRPNHLDYIGVRSFDDAGNLTGEDRFLGLFGASAYNESVTRLPLLRRKAEHILADTGYDPASHGAKAVMAVLDNYPRDELFQADVSQLGEAVETMSRLKDRRQVRLFTRRDRYDRFVSCLVFIPRDRYTTAVRTRIQQILCRELGGETADFTVAVSEAVLARLHLVVRAPIGQKIPGLDVAAVEEMLTRATRTWDDDFADELASQEADSALAHLAAGLPDGYKENFTARQAILDLTALATARPPADVDGEQADEPAETATDEALPREGTTRRELPLALYAPDESGDHADLRLKIFCRGTSLSLTEVLPHLSSLGVVVIDERPYVIAEGTPEASHIYDFGLTVPGGRSAVGTRWSAADRHRFMDAFNASWQGSSESDGFNALIMAAGLTWQQAHHLRAIARYLQQVGSTYSQAHIAGSLLAHTDITDKLAELFTVRFDPAHEPAGGDRTAGATQLTDEVVAMLNDVESLDHDRIFRSYLQVINGIIRTNAYRHDRECLAFKVLPRQIDGLPEPRPAYEIFVYSPRVEGVHLRFGEVARGGLRWSDRAEDYRTEVLGLVKAQMVKNTVIVPVGAKGGFYCKQLPDPTVDRDAWFAEGVACYKMFIGALLDVTDTIVEGAIVPPTEVVRHDGDDAYLVVAADKGTASFSDIANQIAVDRSFWLGDAFASGGSAGYDHKGMGITARGGWESVKRHFRELDRDCQTEDFTCVGVGDMSGDVFGNGMLLSRHTRLVAAFDHRHVFVDPDPEAAAGFAERERLFQLPRSSWADYDTSLISKGGGVFDRKLKSITITPEMKEALGIDADVATLTPTELITAVLKAPVDLLWNGGIGTYVKSSAETDGQVGDRANDAVRVDGRDLRARCVGEGGNLGFTQRGRIEYAAAGGRINTDFIDNSAGVDCSDHEVNIKILLAGEVAAGRLTTPERDRLLAAMTDEVADLVLRHNYDQNLALANSQSQAGSMVTVHEDWMSELEKSGHLDRTIEFMPSTREMERRRETDQGLTAPETATLMAYTKIRMAEEVIASDLPDDPWLADRLINYFPTPMRERYAEVMPEHPLHREIIATVVVNDAVNRAGITSWHRLGKESGAPVVTTIRAHLVAREVFGARELEQRIEALDNQVSASVQTRMRMEVRTLVERATRWVINNCRRPIDIAATVTEYAEQVATVRDQLPELLVGREAARFADRLSNYTQAGVPEDLARAVAVLPESYAALGIARIANQGRYDPWLVTAVHVRLGELIGLDQLLETIVDLPRTDRWQTMARATLRDDLHTLHGQLAQAVLHHADGAEVDAAGADSAPSAETVAAIVRAWQEQKPGLTDATELLADITAGGADLARMSVALRVVRSLVADA
ncbi:NAD-glutamate dehydrogenase [Microlunatus sp. Y2014]|uniref:NAD-glutamate dehydrogenase n=1 Tax=Microlunatus sp. Y2014 TaxID=3418488 RepID=UPI003DA765FC